MAPVKFGMVFALACALLTKEALGGCYGSINGARPRFLLNGGEAIDQKTGLIWKRCSLEAIQFARTEGAGWHVPSGRPT